MPQKPEPRLQVNPDWTCIKCRHFDNYVCQHKNCVDPVTGDQVACNHSRQQLIFCGIDARYFEPKSPPPANVIALVPVS